MDFKRFQKTFDKISILGKRLPPDLLEVDDMLIGIAPCISADLLSVLFRMGHGDELVLADAFFPGDSFDASVEAAYRVPIDRRWPGTPAIARIERFAFYERSKKAFAVVMTGETVKYGNIILKKGVIPVGK